MVRAWRWAGMMTDKVKGLMVSSIQFEVMKKVDFFIVGEPKSGTSALVNFLAQHPDIYMSTELEPHYFCKDLHEEEDGFKKARGKSFFGVRTLESYQRLFKNSNDGQVWGEKSVHYLVSKVAAKNIYKYNPKAKIIVLLREPMDFLKSLHSHYLMTRIETEDLFDKALRLEWERKKGLKVPERAPIASLLFYLENIRYSDHLKRFYEFFDNKAIKVIFYEDFKQNNGDVYRNVLRFLSMDESFVPKFRRVNVRRRFRFNFLFKLTNDSLVYRKVIELIPLRIRRWLAPWCDGIFFKRVKNDDLRISKRMKRKLDKIIKAEVTELTKLLGMNVGAKWK